jgi:hypothetical protein
MRFGVQRLLSVFRIATALLVTGPVAISAQTSPCLTTSPDAETFITSVQAAYGSFGADSVDWKAGGNPFAPIDSISLVTDSLVCAAAVSAYNSHFNYTGAAAVQALFVARIGSSGYVIMHPRDNIGEWQAHLYFDNQWVYKSSVAG